MPRSITSADFIARILHHYPDEICHLHWEKDKPWTLLFAVILSAQCTDARVNMVTPKLFDIFPTLKDYIVADISEIEQKIYSTGYYRNKAKNIQNCAKQLLERHQGKLPRSMEDLVQLSGVGRKTANVVLWHIFEENQGFVVDTHVGRIVRRIGIVSQQYKSPIAIERVLMKKISRKFWGTISPMLVQFGRDFCSSQKPKCNTCFLQDLCPKRGVK